MKPPRLLRAFLFATIWVVSLASRAEPAAPFTWSLNHYQHTAFPRKDGAPLATQLVETSDGYLWTNNTKGLVRFDGYRFQSFVPRPGEALQDKQIVRMFAPQTGGLWLSFQAGISFINHGHITNYKDNAGWHNQPAEFFADRRGALIAYAYPGLMKLVGGAWTRQDDDANTWEVRAICQDAGFNLWAVTKDGRLLVMREGARKFANTGIDVGNVIKITAGADHNIFVSMRSHVIRRFIDAGKQVREVDGALPYYGHATVDHSGKVWLSTPDDGVHFLGPQAGLPSDGRPLSVDERINRSDGLTGNFANVFEDRKGDIWIATEGGLDRLTPSAFSQLPLTTGMTMTAIAPGRSGDAWIGSENFPVRHWARDAMTETAVPVAAMAMHADPNSDHVYAATADALWQLAPGAPRMLAPLPVKGVGAVRAIARTADGQLVASFRGRGVKFARLDGAAWLPIDGLDSPYCLFTDGAGVLWAGLGDNLLASVESGKIKKYSAADGLSVGMLKIIVAHDGLLWLGGDRQLQIWSGGLFRTLKLAGPDVLEDISGLVFDKHNNLWVHTLAGLFKIDRDDLRHALADRHFLPPYRRLDSADGVPGVPAQTYTLPTLTLGADGRLWVAGQTAAAWLDPQALQDLPPLNRPIVEKISDGHADYDLRDARLRLPVTARDLQIAYTTPELQFPARVRFQYRLLGFDDRWQDAGEARTASYSHLPGGAFSFEVRSAYQGQAWSGPATAIGFVIAPTFYEQWWFRFALTVLACAALWAVLRWQVQMATDRERSRMQIRHDEREAIARDLHDTLLQSTQTLAVQLDTIARGVSDPVLRKKLDRLAELSESAGIEGRDKVQLLRGHAATAGDDVGRLIALGERLSAEHGIRFHAQVRGARRSFDAAACEELAPMVGELLNNAFRHSKATAITVIFTFGFWRLGVMVCDDGIGIAEAVLVAGPPKGHWGMQGVKERAAKLGARVVFASMTPSGTKISITVPSRRIYASFKKSPRILRLGI